MIDQRPHEITLLYNSDKKEDLKARVFMESVPGYNVKVIDLKNNPFSESDIAALANLMKVNIEDLLDPAYDDHIRVHKQGLTFMSRSELTTLMTHDSKIIFTPIVVAGNTAYQYGDADDFIKLTMPIQNTVSQNRTMWIR